MNRYVKLVDVKVNMGRNQVNVPMRFSHNEPYNNIELVATKKIVEDGNIYVLCDVKISYGTLEKQFNYSKGDLYYIATPKQTVSSKDIKAKLEESRFLKDIILCIK